MATTQLTKRDRQIIDQGYAQINKFKSVKSIKVEANEAIEFINERPETVLDYADSLLTGVYGCAMYSVYRYDVHPNNRMNRAAWIFNLVVSLEFSLSDRHSRQVWHGLSEDNQKLVDDGIKALMSNFKAEN